MITDTRKSCGCDPDARGFCAHDPKAVACPICKQIVILGFGISEFDAGDDSAVTYDPNACHRCFVAYVRDLSLAARELLS